MAKAKYKLPKVEEMFEAGVHFGHQVRRWHPKMEKFIYGVRRNIHIIDLEQTLSHLEKAAEYLHEVASQGGKIIFVGTKKQAAEVVKSEAENAGVMYVNQRWIGGTFTNFRTIKKNIDKLLKMLKDKESGEFMKYTKLERLMFDREIEKLQNTYGGIITMKDMPKAIVVVDPKREKTAVEEAQKVGIKVVAIVDTNTNPEGIDYVIPGNEDAVKSISVLMRALSEAAKAGLEEHLKVSATPQTKQDATTESTDTKTSDSAGENFLDKEAPINIEETTTVKE